MSVPYCDLCVCCYIMKCICTNLFFYPRMCTGGTIAKVSAGLEVLVYANLIYLFYLNLIFYHILAAFCMYACVPQVNWMERARTQSRITSYTPHTFDGFHIFS